MQLIKHASLPDFVKWVTSEPCVKAAYVGGSTAIGDLFQASEIDLFVVLNDPRKRGVWKCAEQAALSYLSGRYPCVGPAYYFGYGVQYRAIVHGGTCLDVFFETTDTFLPNPMMLANIAIRDDDDTIVPLVNRGQFQTYYKEYERRVVFDFVWQYLSLIKEIGRGNMFYIQKKLILFVEVSSELVFICEYLNSSHPADASFTFYRSFKDPASRQKILSCFGLNDPVQFNDVECTVRDILRCIESKRIRLSASSNEALSLMISTAYAR